MIQKGSLNEYVLFTLERFRTMHVDIKEKRIRVVMYGIYKYFLFYVLKIFKKIWPFRVTFLPCNSNFKCIIK